MVKLVGTIYIITTLDIYFRWNYNCVCPLSLYWGFIAKKKNYDKSSW